MSASTNRKELSNWTPVGQSVLRPRASLLVGVVLCGIATAVVIAARDEPIVLPFMLMFAIGGLSFIVQAARDINRRNAIEARRTQDPDKPWLWEHDWHEQWTADRTAGKWKNAIAFAIVAALFIVPFNFLLLRDDSRSAKIFILIFDAAFAAAMIAVVYIIARRVKYGITRVSFAKFPFAPGEEIHVQLEAGRWLSDVDKLVATLRCVEEHIETRRRGKNHERVIVPYELYADTVDYDVNALRQLELRDLPVRFTLPADAPATTLYPGPIRYWDLEIRAATPGIDYQGHFLLPVYGS